MNDPNPAKKNKKILLKEDIPPTRTYEDVLRHFEIERNIASRLKMASRDERKAIYSTMYDELFSAVPDHPRLIRRDDPQITNEANIRKQTLFTTFIKGKNSVLEIGAGDCRFAIQIADSVGKIYAVDISNQLGENVHHPANFEHIIYDGYELNLADASIDLVYSDQLLEHLHPEDTEYHLRTVYRILRPGGSYIFRTPHRFAGPTDVSKYFCDEAEGFHLKEWTFSELEKLLRLVGYRSTTAYKTLKEHTFRLPYLGVQCYEVIMNLMAHQRRKKIARRILPEICILTYK